MMPIDAIPTYLGHDPVRQMLMSGWQQQRLPHAFLFYGPEGSGKDAYAVALAQLLNCADSTGKISDTDRHYPKINKLQHPDLRFIFPTPAKTNLKEGDLQEALQEKAENIFRQIHFSGKNLFIGIDTIRELKLEARYKLYEGRKKVFIISEAETMRHEAANALLKLLEEPPNNLSIVLTTSNIHQLLPTIKSRCQMIRFPARTPAEIRILMKRYLPDQDEVELETIVKLSGNNIKKAFDYLDKDILKVREQGIEFLRKVILIHRSQELMQVIEPLAAKRDREDAKLMLRFLLSWFQDILHFKNGSVAPEDLANSDIFDTLEKFTSFTPDADIPAIVWEIQQALQKLNDVRNFNPLLILATLAINMQSSIRR